MAQDIATLFLAYSRKKLLEQYWSRLRGAVESLTDEQVWWRPNEASNSIGNLVIHLDGNVRQWLIGSCRRLKDHLTRPAEFAERRQLSSRALLQQLEATVVEAGKVLESLTPDELLA